MHVISRKRLKEAALRHPDFETALDAWFRITKRAVWHDVADVRKTFATADPVERWTVFNIKGNKYRVVVAIKYEFFAVYIRFIGTHEQYDAIDAQTI